MSAASVHIHIDTPIELEEIDKILSAAMEAKQIEMPFKVPSGYRCATCFRGDGGHEPGCAVMMQGMP